MNTKLFQCLEFSRDVIVATPPEYNEQVLNLVKEYYSRTVTSSFDLWGERFDVKTKFSSV